MEPEKAVLQLQKHTGTTPKVLAVGLVRVYCECYNYAVHVLSGSWLFFLDNRAITVSLEAAHVHPNLRHGQDRRLQIYPERYPKASGRIYIGAGIIYTSTFWSTLVMSTAGARLLSSLL